MWLWKKHNDGKYDGRLTSIVDYQSCQGVCVTVKVKQSETFQGLCQKLFKMTHLKAYIMQILFPDLGVYYTIIIYIYIYIYCSD